MINFIWNSFYEEYTFITGFRILETNAMKKYVD